MKQKTLIKNSAYWIGVIAVGVVVGVSLQFVKAAWQEPSTTPPSSNMGAPINTGGAAQNKTGSLGTSGSFSALGTVQGKIVKGTSQVCIGSDCRSAWPSGSGGTSGWSGSGSGTAGRVTKWTGSNKIGNSIIYDTGSRIGINQADPQARLDVNGGIRGVGIQSTGNISAVGNIATTAGTVSGNKVNATTSIYSAGTIKAATTVSGATVKGTEVCIGNACRTTWPSSGTHTTGDNGYSILPSGLIMQWGKVDNLADRGGRTVTFPKSFPKKVLNIQVTLKHVYGEPSPGAKPGWVKQDSINTKSFKLMNSNDGGGPDHFFWYAIGY